jgi:hypothetical protein
VAAERSISRFKEFLHDKSPEDLFAEEAGSRRRAGAAKTGKGATEGPSTPGVN